MLATKCHVASNRVFPVGLKHHQDHVLNAYSHRCAIQNPKDWRAFLSQKSSQWLLRLHRQWSLRLKFICNWLAVRGSWGSLRVIPQLKLVSLGMVGECLVDLGLSFTLLPVSLFAFPRFRVWGSRGENHVLFPFGPLTQAQYTPSFQVGYPKEQTISVAVLLLWRDHTAKAALMKEGF